MAKRPQPAPTVVTTTTASTVASASATEPARNRAIRAEIDRRGIDPRQSGMELDLFVETASTQEDWETYLDLFVPAESLETASGDPALAETSPTGDTWQENSDASPRADVDAAISDVLAEVTSDAVTSDAGTEKNSGPIPWRDPQTLECLPGYEFRIVETPVGAVPMEADKYHVPRHIDVNGLTFDQAVAWRQLFLGLEKSGVKLANGRKVATGQDAIRWLLEQLR